MAKKTKQPRDPFGITIDSLPDDDLDDFDANALTFDDADDAQAADTPAQDDAQPQYTGRLQDDTAAQLTALQAAFKAKAKNEKSRFVSATDSEFWFAVCFQTREQKEAFLEAMKWLEHGDKYLDGLDLAKQQKIRLPAADVRHQDEKPDRKMAGFPPIA